MRETAVMCEGKHGALEAAEYVQIRRFGSEGHGRSGQGSLAVESGGGEAGSGQEVGNGFQGNFVTQAKAPWGQPFSAVQSSATRFLAPVRRQAGLRPADSRGRLSSHCVTC